MTAVPHESQGSVAATRIETPGEHHVLPTGLYLKVFGGLLLLTYLTVHLSYLELGGLSLPAAIAVAMVKAGLVIGFFMHLRYDVRFNSLVFFGTILFVLIFFGFTMLDLSTRGRLNPETATFALEEQNQEVDRAQALQQAAGQSSPPQDGEQQAVEAPAEQTPEATPPPATDGRERVPAPTEQPGD